MVLDASGNHHGLRLVRELLATTAEPVLLGETLCLKGGMGILQCYVLTRLSEEERTPENYVREVTANRDMLMSSTLADIAAFIDQRWSVVAVRGMEVTKLWPRGRDELEIPPGGDLEWVLDLEGIDI